MSLEHGNERPPGVTPPQEPPESSGGREQQWAEGSRDMRPATGTRGGPASWRPEDPSGDIALQRDDFRDARWSFLFKADQTRYAAAEPRPGQVADANRRMRGGPVPEVRGPFIKGPVWTWEVPAYFWAGGVASGASFVALACDLAGDKRSAAVARRVALGAVAPAPLLLIADLGRPQRFLNMLRVFKPRSPMNMGAWCLVAFSSTAAGAVTLDIIRWPRPARALGAITAVLGGYLGSYTGVLLASTAVPLWARSRLLLGPIFVATASATGAAAARLTLVASGLPRRHPSRDALAAIETASILTELALSALNARRIGQAAEALERGRPGLVYRAAQALVVGGLAARIVARRTHPRVHDLASAMYLTGGLAFRFAWVYAGKASAAHHEAVAALGRGRAQLHDDRDGSRPPRAQSVARRPLPLPRVRRAWGEAVRRASLVLDRAL